MLGWFTSELEIIHLCMYVSQPYRFRFVHMYVSAHTYVVIRLGRKEYFLTESKNILYTP